MIGIYKITNPKDEVYVGCSKNIKERYSSHKYVDVYKEHLKLPKSINKYGWENHICEIIEECDETLLLEREEYWITYYKKEVRR